MDGTTKISRIPNPRENACFLSVLSYFYVIPTFIKGLQKDLDESDLTETLTEHQSHKLGKRLEKYWRQEERRCLKTRSSPYLLKVLTKMFGLKFLLYGIVLFVSEMIILVQPIMLGQLITYFTSAQKEIDKKRVYLYGLGVALSCLIQTLMLHPYMMAVCHIGMKIRVACCSLIYRKALRLNESSLGQTTAGQIVNLLANDVKRFDNSVLFIHYLWVGVVQVAIASYFIYLHIGVAAISGILFLIVLVPLQIMLGRKISLSRLKTALRTDERVRLMNEIVSGIHVIKMYTWEKPFSNLVASARRSEIKAIRRTSNLKGIFYSFTLCSSKVSVFLSIFFYVYFGNDITAEKVFVVTAFYAILRQSMTNYLPQGLIQIAEAIVSVNRLNKFLLFDETVMAKNLKNAQLTEKLADLSLKKNPEEEQALLRENDSFKGVILKDITAKWGEDSEALTLNNINLSINQNQLLAIIGPVGSGKSSLLHVLLKELPLLKGYLNVSGEISYASQEPWLFSGSIRQNILFGNKMDKNRYATVVKNCALERDFDLFSHGDKTVIGDKGVGLSGGQKARINLARAVYKNADIYLLDDPLSAVDAQVGRQLFQNCIKKLLKNKIVILVTHQLQYLKDADQIIYLSNGCILLKGTFEELQNSQMDFVQLLGTLTKEDDLKKEKELRNSVLVSSVASSIEDVTLENEEGQFKGTVGLKVYRQYFKAGGNWMNLFGLFLLAQVFFSSADYFLSYWVNMEQVYKNSSVENFPLSYNKSSDLQISNTFYGITDLSRENCIIIYSAIMTAFILVTLFRSFHFFSFCMRASINLHNKMFESITRAVMSFFTKNNPGRIINRFSKDMGAVDEILPSAMMDTLQLGFVFFGVVVVIAIINPLLLVATLIFLSIFIILRTIYVKTSRNIKRLEGITKSPVFGHLYASLQGLTTIRAFQAEETLIAEFDRHMDLHSSAYFMFLYTSRAFGYFLDIACVLFVGTVTFTLLLTDESFGGNIGLAITQVISITGIFQWGVRQSAEMENQMTSVERVLEYSEVQSERPLESNNDRKPPSNWPEEGQIVFNNLSLRYSSKDPLVLKNLSLTILPKEKVGIVGRTGAGKSSLINALFQLNETEGEITIDGIDISSIGLHDLRRKISIIPQEPILFSGSLRKNLDPFDNYTDEDIWKSLEEVELKSTVLELQFGLETRVSERGSNFSIGQRQLICLARAILRNNKILVMDEATANVDPHTDSLIQQTIRNKFGSCTVLTIAHRLDTIIDCDKVLVMDAGTLKEFAHPYELLKNKGLFFAMVQQTGSTMVANFEQVAKQNYKIH